MIQALNDLLAARPFRRPTEYFATRPEGWHGIFTLLIMGTIFSIVQVAVSFLNADTLRAAAEAWRQLAATVPTPPVEAQQGYSLWRPLLLPYYWMLYVLVFAAIRLGVSRLQNIKVPLLDLMGLGAWAAAPFLFFGALLGTYALIVPYTPDHYPLARIFLMSALLFFGWVWEAWIFAKGLRAQAALLTGGAPASTGQAILIWISPALLFVILIALYIFTAAATL